jgi:hypothetical protein
MRSEKCIVPSLASFPSASKETAFLGKKYDSRVNGAILIQEKGTSTLPTAVW